MKPVLVFVLACVAVALAVPIAEETGDNGPAAVALEDVAQDSTAVVDSSNTELVRPKRFLLKKLALAKAGVLGLGALGVAGVGLAAVAAKSAQGGPQGGGGYPGNAVGYTSYYPSTPSYVYSASPTYYGTPGFNGVDTFNRVSSGGIGGEIGGGISAAASGSTGIPYGPPAPVSSGYVASTGYAAPSYQASTGYAAPSYQGFHKTVYVVCD